MTITKKKLVCLDDGHGSQTCGKRTPIFTKGEFANSFMHENEFNNSVIQKIKINLERNDFLTLEVAPTGADTPLAARTNLANNSKADFYISVHANAITGVWQSASGVDTFYHTNKPESKKAAEIIHKYLVQGSPMKDRGCKFANYHVIRETKMPSVLCECGFMDNLENALLLKSEAYRQECADEISKGICEYFGVKWIEAKPVEIPKPILTKTFRVQVGSFLLKSNADTFLTKVKQVGFEAFVVKVGLTYKVQTGVFSVKDNADVLIIKLKDKGFKGIIVEK